jgi:hypothetical protein
VVSILMGMVVAAVLYFWHKPRPVKPNEVDDKRPLKLD